MGNLASSMNRLSDDIVTTYNERMAFMGSLTQNVDGTLKQFRNNRSRMSKDLNSSLSKFVRNLSDSTNNSLKDFRENHEQMAKEQKVFLSGNRKQRITDVDRMTSMFRKEHQKMGKELKGNLNDFAHDLHNTVGDMRKEMSDDISGASMAWKKMSSAMAAKRKGVGSNVGPKSGPKVEEEVEAASPRPFSIKQETPIERIKERFKSKKSG